MDIPRAFADHTVATSVHYGVAMFVDVMSLPTREMTSCSAFLTVGGELPRSADVRRLGNKPFKFEDFVGIHLIFILFQ
jgi:hypothetical protein